MNDFTHSFERPRRKQNEWVLWITFRLTQQIYIYIYITTFRTYLISFFFDEKISIKGRKSYSKVQTASPNYIQSKCIRVLTTGGETPLHKWHTLLHRANLASSCATLLKSLFRCRICQQAKPSRRPTIPLTK